jgi:hypothetical protein
VARNKVSPLDWKTPIVDPKTGVPTLQYIRQWQAQFGNEDGTHSIATSAATVAGAAVPQTRNVNATSPVTVNGGTTANLATDITLAHATSGVSAGTYGDSTHVAQFVVDAKGHITSASNVAVSGSGGASASIRSSNIQSSSAASYTVTFPTGASAGDLVIIICGSGFGMTLPSTWTWLEHASQSNFLGDVFCKVLTSTDITNGSVTVSQSGTFNAVICAICFVGAPTIKNVSSTHNATGSATRTVTISSGFTATDFAVYWGMNRNASADTLNKGSAVQSINAASASGVVTAGTTGATSITLTASYGTISGTTGDYQGILVLSG